MPTVFLNKKDFLGNIRKGFKDEKALLHQFEIDYPRVKFLIDGVLIDQTTYKHTDFIKWIWYITKENKETYHNFLSCCTQCIMSYPLERLHSYLPMYILADSKTPLVIMINSQNLSFLIHKKIKVYSTRYFSESNKTPKELTNYNIQIKFDLPLEQKGMIEIKYERD